MNRLYKDIKVSLIGNNPGEVTDTVTVNNIEQFNQILQSGNWSHLIFTEGKRAAAHFIETDLLVLDIDGKKGAVNKSLEEIKADFSDYMHIIKPTKSHGIDKDGLICDRCRVILFLERTIKSKEDYYETWTEIYNQFPYIDPATKDVARMWYPCIEGEAYSINLEGQKVRVYSGQRSRKTEKGSSKNLSNYLSRLSGKASDFFLNGAPDGSYNSTLYSVAKECCKKKIPKHIFLGEASKGSKHEFDKNDIATIESAYKEASQQTTSLDLTTRELMWESLTICDYRDTSRTYLFHEEDDEFMQIDRGAIWVQFGDREAFKAYMSQNACSAIIEYEPQSKEKRLYRRGKYNYFNVYEKPLWLTKIHPTETSSLPNVYEAFFRHLTDNDTASYEYLLDWLANSLQNRNRTILVAIGEQGIGKGVLGDIMKELHGEKNYSKTNDGVFKERFNGPLLYKTLVHVDEIKIGNNDVAYNRLKDVVNDTLQIEEKCKNQVTINNHASFYICSNNLDAIPIEDGQRRFSLIWLTEQKLYDSEILNGYHSVDDFYAELMKQENIQNLGMYLLHRKLDKNKLIRPFVSKKLEQLKSANLKEWEEWFIFDYCVKNYRNGGTNLHDVIDTVKPAIKKACPELKTAPGRNKLEDLSKRYPKAFIVVKRSNENTRRLVEILPTVLDLARDTSDTARLSEAKRHMTQAEEDFWDKYGDLAPDEILTDKAN
jgi:hypothetical protein